MAKAILNWKAPSEKVMADLMETWEEEMQIEFANACGSIVDDKVVINKTKAREWLTSHFDGTDEIEWINRPVKKEKKLSGADRIGKWLRR